MFSKSPVHPGQKWEGNIVLIGMPGSGKSTVGVLLAKLMGRGFIDTDILLQVSAGRSLQEIVDKDGFMALRAIEEETILDLCCRNHVIATGGSAVYGDRAMAHLRGGGTIVFLDVDMKTLEGRINDFDTRGLAKEKGQTLADLFIDRIPLYRKWSDLTIDGTGLSQETICLEITSRLSFGRLSG